MIDLATWATHAITPRQKAQGLDKKLFVANQWLLTIFSFTGIVGLFDPFRPEYSTNF